MDRWWGDSDRARGVLECVDGSDVSQGVASAVLGLHALNAAALAPLAQTTLVDRATVERHLRRVDLTPVASAVARATRSVMGDASATYGALVAKSWQSETVDSADRILARWTAQGLPWPTAVQRLTSVVGLPVGAAGGVVAKLQVPAMNELVAKDYGDRALLQHALRVGEREAVGAVSKVSASERSEFDREHPRDTRGRFADKPDTPEAARQRREQRRDSVRSLRRMRVADKARRAVAPPRQEASWGLLGLLPKRQNAQRTDAKRQGFERKTERKAERTVSRSQKENKSALVESDTAYSVQPAYDKDYAYALDQESYVILSLVDAVSLMAGAKDNGFNGAGLREIVGTMPVAFDQAHVQNELNNMARAMPEQEFVVLKLGGVAVVDDTNYSVNLADAGAYRVDMAYSDIDPNSMRLGMQMDSGFYMPANGNPARSVNQGKPVPMIDAYLSNFGEFPSQTRNLPYDRFGNLEKALSGFEVEQFNRLHPRDEEGQFTTASTAGPADAASRERRVRRRNQVRARRRRIQERQAAAARQGQQETVMPAVFERPQRRNAVRQPAQRTAQRQTGRKPIQRRVMASTLVEGSPDKQQRFDFARATGWVMSSQELTDLAGLDIDGNWVGDDFAGVGMSAPELAQDRPLVPGQEALRKLSTAWRKGMSIKSTVKVDGGPYKDPMAAEERAGDFVRSMDMSDYDEDLVARAYPESRLNAQGEEEWVPRVAMIRDHSLSDQVVIFGSNKAMADMTEHGSDIDPERLVLIHTGPLDGLLKLRSSDESIATMPLNEPRSNGFVRAFWYQDEG